MNDAVDRTAPDEAVFIHAHSEQTVGFDRRGNDVERYSGDFRGDASCAHESQEDEQSNLHADLDLMSGM